MQRFISLFLCKVCNSHEPRLRYSAVRRLLDIDKMADDSTCKIYENSVSCTETSEDVGSLKRSLSDDIKIEDTSNKRLKTELVDAKVPEDSEQEKVNSVPRIRKKKCALLLSYCGAGYNGMQINPGVRTIEEELLNALFKAEVITEDDKACLGKMSFQRCARTDKGVSAARQVVSLKISITFGSSNMSTAQLLLHATEAEDKFQLDVLLGLSGGYTLNLISKVEDQSLVPKINEHLPPEIRVIALKRTTRGFDAKGNCSARTYEYLTPTFAFAKDYQTTSSYRVTGEKIEEVNCILSKFIGTHNYHNFTSGKKFNDASAKRYIMKFKCGKPFEEDGREFITIAVKGQSFMLHQIRKMIGLALAIVRGVAPLSTLDLTRKEKKVDIPKAPPVGLVLDEVHFEAYNRRYGDDGMHESLEWDENEEEIQKFKRHYIYKHILDTDARDHVMMRWLKTLPDHSYTDERMEEIHSKTDEKGTKQESNTEAKTTGHSEDPCSPGGSADTKQISEDGESDENKQSESTGDVTAGL